MTANRAQGLARLDVFVGEWSVEVQFPGAPSLPSARSWFEWELGGQFLLQHTEVPIPEVPDSLTIIRVDLETGAYSQHYYDSRGVTRLYAMSFVGRTWTLSREAPDFMPLEFGQRFVGTFSEDADTIEGAWEKSVDNGVWEHDFHLTYRRVG